VKTFIKLVATTPSVLKKSHFEALGQLLEPDEKVHIAILAAESARQSSLLYGLHAVFLAAK